jgi:hypothetical protein
MLLPIHKTNRKQKYENEKLCQATPESMCILYSDGNQSYLLAAGEAVFFFRNVYGNVKLVVMV